MGCGDSCHHGLNCVFEYFSEHDMVCLGCLELGIFIGSSFVVFGRLWSLWRPFSRFLSVYALPVSGVYIDKTLSYENTTPRRCFFKEMPPAGGVFTDRAWFGLI